MTAAASTHDRYSSHVTRHLKPGPHALVEYLDRFKRRKQAAYPSQKHLAARFGVTPRTIQRWTATLEDAGLVAVERHRPHHHHLTGQWKRRTNRYRCQFKKREARMRGKDQVTPRRHLCRQNALLTEQCSGDAPEPVVSPPPEAPEEAAPPPWEGTGLTAAEWTRRKMGQL